MKLEIMIDGIDEDLAYEIKKGIENIIAYEDYGGDPAPDVSFTSGDDDADHLVEVCKECGERHYAYQMTDGVCEDCVYEKEHKKEG